jgi:hypothetical protein
MECIEVNIMEKTPKNDIVSFIIRFVQNQSKEKPDQNVYRGSIRHIQSDQEISFTKWDEAEDFIQHYVPINRKSPF